MCKISLDIAALEDEPSRMNEDDAIDKSYETRRAVCESDIATLLRNLGGAADVGAILGVYHLHYAPMRKSDRYVYMRRDQASQLLRSMEDRGLVACTYDADGLVVTVRIK